MRVISGKYRGKIINIPKDDRIRPTMDRIKETVFNVIQGYIDGSRVLDLFAGTGNLGIESISRGAKEVVFVDNHPDSISLINNNLKGISDCYEVVKSDYSIYLQSVSKQFDIIFVDAPYHTELGNRAVKIILERDLLAEGGVICFEHDSRENMKVDVPGNFFNKTKKMGNITFNFLYKVKTGIFTGSFDPFTRGHLAVVQSALELFDKLYIACLINQDKKYLFTPNERVEIVKMSLLELGKVSKKIEVIYSEKYAYKLYDELNASALIRSIRNDEDAKYEKIMEEYNNQYGAKTIFVDVPEQFKKYSSTQIRENLHNNNYDGIVPSAINLVKKIIDRS